MVEVRGEFFAEGIKVFGFREDGTRVKVVDAESEESASKIADMLNLVPGTMFER